MAPASPDDTEWRFPNRATPFGSPRYYAVRFSPAAQRDRSALLLAWYDLIQQVADRPLDPGVARLKLDWWREEVTGLCAGRARHLLAAALQRRGIDDRVAMPMQAIIDAAEEEIRSPFVADETAFGRACRGSLGSFFALLCALDDDPACDPEHCRQAGAYCDAVERLRRAAVSPHRLPTELRPAALAGLPAAQRGSLCATLLEPLRVEATRSPQSLPDLARRLTALAGAMHRKIRRRGYPVSDTLIDRPPIADLWTAWRCR